MTILPFDWGAALNTLRIAAADLEANTPLSVGPPMTMADTLAALQSAQPFLAALDAWVKSRPGAIRALMDILKGMEAQGVPWATELYGVASQAPGGLDAAEAWLPTVIGALAAIQPAPGWGDGGTGYVPGPGNQRGGVPQ